LAARPVVYAAAQYLQLGLPRLHPKLNLHFGVIVL